MDADVILKMVSILIELDMNEDGSLSDIKREDRRRVLEWTLRRAVERYKYWVDNIKKDGGE